MQERTAAAWQRNAQPLCALLEDPPVCVGRSRELRVQLLQPNNYSECALAVGLVVTAARYLLVTGQLRGFAEGPTRLQLL